MPEPLGDVTGLTVVQAEEGQAIAADDAYVIAPSWTLTVTTGSCAAVIAGTWSSARYVQMGPPCGSIAWGGLPGTPTGAP